MNRERLSYSHYTERRLGNDYSYSQIQKNMTYDSGDDYPSRPTRGSNDNFFNNLPLRHFNNSGEISIIQGVPLKVEVKPGGPQN